MRESRINISIIGLLMQLHFLAFSVGSVSCCVFSAIDIYGRVIGMH